MPVHPFLAAIRIRTRHFWVRVRAAVSTHRTSAAIGAVTLVLLTALVTYMLAPSQEVAAQRAVEADQQRTDASTVGAEVMDAYNESLFGSQAFEGIVESDVLDREWGSPSGLSQPHYTVSADTFYPPDTEGLGGQSVVNFTLVGRDYAGVLIRDVKARMISRKAPLSGTIVYAAPQGGSEALDMIIDLESKDKGALTWDPDTRTHPRCFDRKQISLAKDEIVKVRAEVVANSCVCEYFLDVLLSDGSTVTVSDNGKPWVTRTFSLTYERAYRIGLGDYDSGVKYPCQWPDQCLQWSYTAPPPR